MTAGTTNPDGAVAQSCTFGPLTIGYDARVLTPRPWTLLQSAWAAELAREAPAGPLLEICAGAGHIGLVAALDSGRPLVQIEADPVAAQWARSNAAAAGLAEHVDVRQAPMHNALEAGEQFPVVLADPPYLPTAEIERWPEDPVSAIDGGADGLDLVRQCLAVAADHLLPGGPLLLQVAGDAQAEAVRALSADGPLRWVDTRRHDAERAVVLLRRDR